MKKTWIKIKRGILEPKHIDQLSVAWYLYFYILDNADWETGTIKEWKDKYAADELGKPLGMIREHRKLLEEHYIDSIKNRYDQTIVIRNWTNPRMYDGVIINEGYIKQEPSQEEEPQSKTQSKGQSKTQSISNPPENLHSSYSHISHNTNHKETKEEDPQEQKINEQFKTMHQVMFPGSFNKIWWEEMEAAPKRMDGKLLRITVQNEKMVEQVNARMERSMRTIASCNFEFATFVLEVPKEESEEEHEKANEQRKA